MKNAIQQILGAHMDGIDAGFALQQKKINTLIAAATKAYQLSRDKELREEILAAIEYAKGEKPAGGDLFGHVSPVIAEHRGNSYTQIRVRGRLDDVLDKVREIFKTFPAAAYGTHCHHVSQFSEDGTQYEALLSRSNSAD